MTDPRLTTASEMVRAPSPDAVERARAELAAALAQVAPSDDPIIVHHIRTAYRLLGGSKDL